ncbi:hypothetical protein CIK76_05005 [Glutamicibacter sp. BW80]|uniref:hypothetical protein n=1 Tax=unclassified Glutamicibacter TaxID=2627139 RepID=UPI000BB7FD92|nr:hypothetical protein [Glutamicibacter sp. BW80]PCC29753.1 hypothetical protein CIK76_05005 [Glutamicibacter sp. BW80]
MAEQYSKVEVVTPALNGEGWFGKVFAAIFMLALRTLIVWWFVAAWFPEIGLTFWQLVLPVYAIRTLFGNTPFTPRMLKK